MTAALESHLIPLGALSGEYDELYQIFLEDRAKMIISNIRSHVLQERELLVSKIKASEQQLLGTEHEFSAIS